MFKDNSNTVEVGEALIYVFGQSNTLLYSGNHISFPPGFGGSLFYILVQFPASVQSE